MELICGEDGGVGRGLSIADVSVVWGMGWAAGSLELVQPGAAQTTQRNEGEQRF